MSTETLAPLMPSGDPLENPAKKKIVETVQLIAFEIGLAIDGSVSKGLKLLTVRNLPEIGRHRKPGGIGLPGGQVDACEQPVHAIKRETGDEAGYVLQDTYGRLFTESKVIIENGERTDNRITLFYGKASDLPTRVNEIKEIDVRHDPWSLSLWDFFTYPVAQSKDRTQKNPKGVYFSHRRRFVKAMDMVLHNPESLIDELAIMKAFGKDLKYIRKAMAELYNAGLLEQYCDDLPVLYDYED